MGKLLHIMFAIGIIAIDTGANVLVPRNAVQKGNVPGAISNNPIPVPFVSVHEKGQTVSETKDLKTVTIHIGNSPLYLNQAVSIAKEDTAAGTLFTLDSGLTNVFSVATTGQ